MNEDVATLIVNILVFLFVLFIAFRLVEIGLTRCAKRRRGERGIDCDCCGDYISPDNIHVGSQESTICENCHENNGMDCM